MRTPIPPYTWLKRVYINGRPTNSYIGIDSEGVEIISGELASCENTEEQADSPFTVYHGT